MLQVFAIEFIALAIKFVTLVIEFITLANEVFPFHPVGN